MTNEQRAEKVIQPCFSLICIKIIFFSINFRYSFVTGLCTSRHNEKTA